MEGNNDLPQKERGSHGRDQEHFRREQELPTEDEGLPDEKKKFSRNKLVAGKVLRILEENEGC